jgi:hypothetical protein
MDSIRFDRLVRVLATRHRRRGTLPLLALLGLRLVDSDAAEAAKSGKCRRKPGVCETCKKGKCERKHGKKTCKAGKITPKANGTACTGGSCQSGLCVAPSGPVVLPPGPVVPPPPPAEIPATCSDGITNGNETDVDCGGPDCPRCADGKACLASTDCVSGSCITHVCMD